MTAHNQPLLNNTADPEWGSDLIALALRELGFPYVCLVPGASFRGIHDSIVNFLGNRDPEMLVCLHEEHAVSIAQGYAKVTGRPLPVLLHANVGALHASMSIFNAWCDRMPVLAIGATGPIDAEKRRSWIDWIHTSIDQGGPMRGFLKWDDAPGSAVAAVESIRRGAMIAATRPCGPVYINIDSAIQEAPLPAAARVPPADWYRAARSPGPGHADVDDALAMIARARRPALLCGRASRSEAAWAERVAFAEAIGAAVFGEYNSATTFPRSHPLYAETLKFTLRGEIHKDLREADLIVSLDWTALGDTLEQVWGRKEGGRPTVIACSNDQETHRGWNMDYQRLPAADLRVQSTPEAFVGALLQRGVDRDPGRRTAVDNPQRNWSPPKSSGARPHVSELAGVYRDVTAGLAVSLVSAPLGWPVGAMRCEHPLDYLGSNGGGGLGAGPGIAIGAALALRDVAPGRLAIAIVGDGDYLMGANALWTAAKHGVPLLMVVANNRSYFNDETHQEHMARVRARPVENKWIGQRLDDPAPDLAGFARAQGVEAIGPVEDLAGFEAALRRGIEIVKTGRPCVIDAVVSADYAG